MEHCLGFGGVLMVIVDLRIYNVDLSFVVRVCVCVAGREVGRVWFRGT